MKTRVRTYIGLVLALALLAGCRREPLAPDGNVPEGKVKLSFRTDIPDFEPAETKALVETPVCSRLFVTVFDEHGLLAEVAEASSVSASGTTGTFTVSLTPSGLPRTLHFLALPSDSPLPAILNALNPNDKTDEAEFASLLVTPDGQAACWGRKELTTLSAETDLSGIPLVRNYAKVTVRVGDGVSNFVLDGFRVFNASQSGMAVPFNGRALQNKTGFDRDLFPNFFSGSGSAMRSYADVSAQGYRGFLPASRTLRTPTTADAASYSAYLTGTGAADYVFETRYNPEIRNDNAYILFKGRFNGAATPTWYKADFVYEDENSVPAGWGYPDRLPYDILRNYAYVLTITGVIGEGYSTAADAAAQPAHNNFEGSVASTDIGNVQELNSALYLSQTAIELPRNSEITYIDLYYRNEMPKGDANVHNVPDTDVYISAAGDAILAAGVVETGGKLNLGASGVVSEAVDAAAVTAFRLKAGAWWHLRLPVSISSDGTGTLQQTITVKNRAGLSRHCMVSVRPHYPFEIIGYAKNPNLVLMPETPPATGDLVRLQFRIPDGIPPALFPLEFQIESYASETGKQVLQPHAAAIEAYRTGKVGDWRIELPVSGVSGSIVGNADDSADLDTPSYHFTRSVTWTEYSAAILDVDEMKTFPLHLRPIYNPRSSSEVTALGSTTVWMRQGTRGGTYFSYRDDEGGITRRWPFRLTLGYETYIALPAIVPAQGDFTADDGKPVYKIVKGTPRSLTVGVKRLDNDATAYNALTLDKELGTAPFSMAPAVIAAGTGSIEPVFTATRVTGEKYRVNVAAETSEYGGLTYGESENYFYVQPAKGRRTVTFDADKYVLRNQTLQGSVPAVYPTLPAGTVLTYSLSPSDVVTENAYARISQMPGTNNFTVTGLAATDGSTVTVYAIAPEDDDYEESYGELAVHVKQGRTLIDRNEWRTSDNGYVGVVIPISGSVWYDEAPYTYTPASVPYSTADIWFESSDHTVATVEGEVGDDGTTWRIVPRGVGPCTLTMHVRGTDDNGDSSKGGTGDIFKEATFEQTFTVLPSWWKVLNGTIVSGKEYAISDVTDSHIMTTTMGVSNSYRRTARYCRDHYLEQDNLTSWAYGNGKYFLDTTYGYTVSVGSSGYYSIQNGSNYLFPKGHDWSLVDNFTWRESADNDGLYLSDEEPDDSRTKTNWDINSPESDTDFYMEHVTYNSRSGYSGTGKYINYNQSGRDGRTYFDNNGGSSNYNHLWKKCTSIDDIKNCGYIWPAATP